MLVLTYGILSFGFGYFLKMATIPNIGQRIAIGYVHKVSVIIFAAGEIAERNVISFIFAVSCFSGICRHPERSSANQIANHQVKIINGRFL